MGDAITAGTQTSAWEEGMLDVGVASVDTKR